MSTSERCKIINEIEAVLGRNGYARFRQVEIPGEHKMAYVNGSRIITISDIFDASDSQVSLVIDEHMAISKSKGGSKKERSPDEFEQLWNRNEELLLKFCESFDIDKEGFKTRVYDQFEKYGIMSVLEEKLEKICKHAMATKYLCGNKPVEVTKISYHDHLINDVTEKAEQ